MPENRQLESYYAETAEVLNPTGGTMNIYETITLVSLSDRLNVVFKGWNDPEFFRTYARSNNDFIREFNPLVTDLNEEERTKISSVKSDILGILGVSSDDYNFKFFQLDSQNLSGIITAEHKTIPTQLINRIITPENFNLFKNANIAKVLDFQLFCWTYGKSKDAFLNSLSPIQ